MKIFLRNILLGLFFLLNPFYDLKSQQTIHTDETGYVYDWNLSNQTCYGCGSFYISVWDANIYNKGYYTFYVYFWSNSFYQNGYAANSYVSNINITFINNGQKTHILGPYYFIAVPKSKNFNGFNLAAVLYSTNPKQIININWGGVIAY